MFRRQLSLFNQVYAVLKNASQESGQVSDVELHLSTIAFLKNIAAGRIDNKIRERQRQRLKLGIQNELEENVFYCIKALQKNGLSTEDRGDIERIEKASIDVLVEFKNIKAVKALGKIVCMQAQHDAHFANYTINKIIDVYLAGDKSIKDVVMRQLTSIKKVLEEQGNTFITQQKQCIRASTEYSEIQTKLERVISVKSYVLDILSNLQTGVSFLLEEQTKIEALGLLKNTFLDKNFHFIKALFGKVLPILDQYCAHSTLLPKKSPYSPEQPRGYFSEEGDDGNNDRLNPHGAAILPHTFKPFSWFMMVQNSRLGRVVISFVGGAIGGGGIGAIIGSFILPGVGTVLGLIIGAEIGAGTGFFSGFFNETNKIWWKTLFLSGPISGASGGAIAGFILGSSILPGIGSVLGLGIGAAIGGGVGFFSGVYSVLKNRILSGGWHAVSQTLALWLTGGSLGGLAGLGVGAMVGTMIFPGVGTLLGMAAGAAIGAIAGSCGGIYSFLKRKIPAGGSGVCSTLGKACTSTLAGVGIGMVIGSIFPVVGTTVGGILGAGIAFVGTVMIPLLVTAGTALLARILSKIAACCLDSHDAEQVSEDLTAEGDRAFFLPVNTPTSTPNLENEVISKMGDGQENPNNSMSSFFSEGGLGNRFFKKKKKVSGLSDEDDKNHPDQHSELSSNAGSVNEFPDEAVESVYSEESFNRNNLSDAHKFVTI